MAVKPTIQIGHLPGELNATPYNAVRRTLFRGMIVDVLSYNHHYEVALDGRSNMPGVALTGVSASSIGIRDHSMYQVGDTVLCYHYPEDDYVVILGAIPQHVGDPAYNSSDWLLMHSAVGILDDPAHDGFYKLQGNRKNFNASRPCDAMPGDHGVMSALGVGYNVNLVSAFMRAGDLNGIWFHQLEALTKLYAHNWRFLSAIKFEDAGDDEGEHYGIQRTFQYPWEAIGSRAPNSVGIRTPFGDPPEKNEIGFDPTWQPNSHEARYEPKYPDQCGIARRIILNGYLFGIERDIVCAPPTSLIDSERLGNRTNYIGLAETTKHLDGAMEFRSRRSITFEKSAYIPVPKQLAETFDPRPDDELTSKRSGVYGENDELDYGELEFDQDFSALQFIDYLAWLRQKSLTQDIKLRNKDWHTSKESETEGYNGTSVDKSIFADGNSFRSKVPAFHQIAVDHRPNNTRKYYKSRSIIHQNEMGEIIIEDAWGSQIIMSRGNITLSAKNDVVLANGRNLVALVPNDIILRAGSHCDVSAGSGDVRIKADKNLHMLSGNSGSGGILLESRGTGLTQDYQNKVGSDVRSSGVTIVAKESGFSTYAQQVYLRSIENGKIILDADDGQSNIEIFAGSAFEHIRDRKTTYFGVRPSVDSSPTATVILDERNVIFSQNGTMSTNAQILCNNQVIVDGNFVAQDVSTRNGGEMSRWGPQTRSIINTAQSRVGTAVTASNQSSAVPRRAGQPYSSEGLGQRSTWLSIGFSFRSDEQYGIDFGSDDEMLFLVEARWQQQYRELGVGSPWEEPEVNSPDGSAITMPFPGYASWMTKNLFGQVDNSFWSAEAGETESSDQYTQENVQSVSRTTFNENYFVTWQKA